MKETGERCYDREAASHMCKVNMNSPFHGTRTPANSFRVQVLSGDRALAPMEFDVPATSDWRKLTMLFNSLDRTSVRLYAGTWGAKSGRLWLDDLSLEEVGPINVLRRPGTPVTVTSEDGKTTYVENRDFAPLVDPHYSPYRVAHDAPNLKLLPGGKIHDGEHLRVSWYHILTSMNWTKGGCRVSHISTDILRAHFLDDVPCHRCSRQDHLSNSPRGGAQARRSTREVGPW